MRNSERGQSIYLEGVGGAGKTTQIDNVLEYVRSLGHRALKTREPGGDPAAEKIRSLIFNLKDKGVANADHQMALFFASRYLWVTEIVKPNIDSGVDVVSDRSWFSTAAYQGYAEGGDLETIKKFADVVMGDYKPDAVILLNISAKTAMARQANKSDFDPYDKEGVAYFEKLVNGYQDMAKKNFGEVPWIVINADQSKQAVESDIQTALQKFLKR